MSGSVMSTVDTEGAPGGAATVPSSQHDGTDAETSVSYAGGKTSAEPAPPAAGPTFDTEAANGGEASSELTPGMTVTPVTTETNSGPVDVEMPYRAPSAPPGGSTQDTTYTQNPTTDGLPPSADPGTLMSATIDCANIGAAPAPVGGVPAAPTGVTAADGPRSVTVSWTAVANPDNSTNKIIDYVVLGSTGGTTFAGANATSAVVTNLVPGQSYTFQVAARSAAGMGPYSTASAAATAYDPDEPDVNKPAGLASYNTTEPIYRSDGTIVPGSWGRPTAPTGVTETNGGAATDVTVTWTAPTTGAPSGGYSVAITDATTGTTTTHAVAGNVLTYTFTGLVTGHNVTSVVTAIGPLASTSSAASAAFAVP